MNPLIAAIIYLGFVAYLLRRDFRERPNVTSALWIPSAWLFIMCSRPVSTWLGMAGLPGMRGTLEDGSPVDAAVFALLIFLGFRVLVRRRIDMQDILRNNPTLTLFLLYCLLSILWSDFQFVAFKRWIKILGHPIMALVLLTEPNREEAMMRMIRRCGFILMPVSVLFIKYFPDWGRGYDKWTGAQGFMGITLDKNALGYDCFIVGLVFFWQFLKVLKWEKGRARRDELILNGIFLAMTGWLMSMAQSSTAMVAWLVAMAGVWVLGFKFVNPRRLGFYLVALVAVIGVLQLTIDVYGRFLHILGKDPTLTDRTLIWKAVLEIPNNPVIGTGFESFWLGERLQTLWAQFWFEPNQAHNGYLETYLNLGWIGLIMMLALIFAAYGKGVKDIVRNGKVTWGRFRVGFLVGFVLYNWTEATFKAIHPVWFVFYIIAMDYPWTTDDSKWDSRVVAGRLDKTDYEF